MLFPWYINDSSRPLLRSWMSSLSPANSKSPPRSPYSELYVLIHVSIHIDADSNLQVTQADSIEEQENSEDTMARLGSLGSRGP